MSNAGTEGNVARETITLGALNRWLRLRGVSEREITAIASEIDDALWTAVQARVPETLHAMEQGIIPRSGFGFSGEAGRGKTFAMVCYMRALVEDRWRENKVEAAKAWLEWRRWPEWASEMRAGAVRDGGYADAEHEAKRLARVPALVLDDLGAERMKGSGYEDDWIASTLDLLIDRRYNALLPTWYTTNLTAQEIRSRYGARLYSRLCSENKLISVPTGPDLRVNNARSQ